MCTKCFTVGIALPSEHTLLVSIIMYGLGLLTLGAHAQRGLQYLVCLSVCPSVTTFSATTRNKQVK